MKEELELTLNRTNADMLQHLGTNNYFDAVSAFADAHSAYRKLLKQQS